MLVADLVPPPGAGVLAIEPPNSPRDAGAPKFGDVKPPKSPPQSAEAPLFDFLVTTALLEDVEPPNKPPPDAGAPKFEDIELKSARIRVLQNLICAESLMDWNLLLQ